MLLCCSLFGNGDVAELPNTFTRVFNTLFGFGCIVTACVRFKTKFVTSLLSPRMRDFLFTYHLIKANMTAEDLGRGITLPLRNGLS